MYARLSAATRALSTASGALLLLAGTAIAGPPVHSVRGHGIYALVPPAPIQQVTINASVDEDGVIEGSLAVWPGWDDTADAGWTWVIRIDSLTVTPPSAFVVGTIVFDNRFPEQYIGVQISFLVTDNGNGASDPADLLNGVPILGGNFKVN